MVEHVKMVESNNDRIDFHGNEVELVHNVYNFNMDED